MEMKKLVVNGVAYTVADPDAACIDDTKVGADAWSGKHIADRLCPGFSVSGSTAVCTPLEGYPLSVVSRMEPVQAGEGDPAPAGWVASELGVYPQDETSGDTEAFVSDALRAGKTYRITVNATDTAGAQISLSQDCSIYMEEDPEYPYCHIISVSDDHIDFVAAADAPALISLYYESEIDGSSMYDYDEEVSVYALKDGVFTLQEYDPGNLRPITGHSAVKLTRNGEEFTMELGQTVYGGSLDWATGALVIHKKSVSFTGKETGWNRYVTDTADTTGFSIMLSDKKVGFKTSICNMFKNTNDSKAFSRTYMAHGLYTDHSTLRNCYFDWGPYYPSAQSAVALAGFKAWLKEMQDAGTPVQLCYQLAEPITVRLEPREILALSGTNTLYSDTGDTEVTGREDLQTVLQKLMEVVANA